MRFRTFILGCLAATILAPSRPAAAALVYAIGDGGASLIRLDTASPGSATRVGFFGGADTFLDAIDFRPATGELYGYRDATDSYYTVNLANGQLTLASDPDVGARTNTFVLGMDFNPTIDRLRVVTESAQNIVYNPLAGTAAAFTPLFYGAGDVNEDLVPLVVENAYTNNVPGAGATQQYVLDHGLNTLATLANNAGTLSTVGPVTLNGSVLDFDEYAGFDILSAGGLNTAYALLTVGGTPGLYTMNLQTGNATALGSIGTGFGPVYGLAAAPVPEPSTLALLGIGAGGVWLLARRRGSRR